MDGKDEKKYRVICYLRVEPDDVGLLTYEEAMEELNHLELLQPENKYVIEMVKK